MLIVMDDVGLRADTMWLGSECEFTTKLRMGLENRITSIIVF